VLSLRGALRSAIRERSWLDWVRVNALYPLSSSIVPTPRLVGKRAAIAEQKIARAFLLTSGLVILGKRALFFDATHSAPQHRVIVLFSSLFT
jgi:hypothetical protein